MYQHATLALACAFAGHAAAQSQVTFRTQFEDMGSGQFRMTAAPSAGEYEAFLADFLGLYRLSDNPLFTASHVESVNPLFIDTNPVSHPSLDDTGNFGEIGDTVNFNPLATGGTHDIATGGDYIDAQLGHQRVQMEIAQVDVETNVFRQEFGPVQTSQRNLLGSNVETYSFSWIALNAWEPWLFEHDGSGLTGEFDITLSVVPAPSGGVLLALGGLVAMRRRR